MSGDYWLSHNLKNYRSLHKMSLSIEQQTQDIIKGPLLEQNKIMGKILNALFASTTDPDKIKEYIELNLRLFACSADLGQAITNLVPGNNINVREIAVNMIAGAMIAGKQGDNTSQGEIGELGCDN